MQDPPDLPPLWRLAEAIRLRLLVGSCGRIDQVGMQLDKLVEPLAEFQKIKRGLAICRDRNWPAAARVLTARLDSVVSNVPYFMEHINRASKAAFSPVPSLRDLHADLEQLIEEFGAIRYDRGQRRLVVVTEPIELEGTYLGEFEIRLDIPQIGTRSASVPYSVVALDPHPAAANDLVTHPHVSDETLCAGDSAAAVNAALNSGRICDFFLMVRSILTTYNPESPFIPLKDWCGLPCYDCGYTIGYEDGHWCSYCERDFCGECSSYCRTCNETTCNICLESCPECGEPVCPRCMTTCPECDRQRCKSCSESPCPCQTEDTEDTQDSHDHQRNQTRQDQARQDQPRADRRDQDSPTTDRTDPAETEAA